MSTPAPLKHYVSYSEIHNGVKKLADLVMNSDRQIDVIVAIGTGGLIPGRILKTYIKKPLLFVTVNLYDDTTNTAGKQPVKVQWINEKSQIQGKNIVIVDEVDDTRMTFAYVSQELQLMEPESISWLTVFNKKKQKKAEIPSFIRQYWIACETDDIWLRFPWDASDFEEHEQLANSDDNKKLKSNLGVCVLQGAASSSN